MLFVCNLQLQRLQLFGLRCDLCGLLVYNTLFFFQLRLCLLNLFFELSVCFVKFLVLRESIPCSRFKLIQLVLFNFQFGLQFTCTAFELNNAAVRQAYLLFVHLVFLHRLQQRVCAGMYLQLLQLFGQYFYSKLFFANLLLQLCHFLLRFFGVLFFRVQESCKLANLLGHVSLCLQLLQSNQPLVVDVGRFFK